MKLKWYGHASFRIESAEGVSLITDPYTPETAGYAPITETAGLVVTSSDDDSYHCRADLIPGDPTILNALTIAQNGGSHTTHGLTIEAIEAMENWEGKGEKRNAIPGR